LLETALEDHRQLYNGGAGGVLPPRESWEETGLPLACSREIQMTR
jgi:hypothetical protein